MGHTLTHTYTHRHHKHMHTHMHTHRKPLPPPSVVLRGGLWFRVRASRVILPLLSCATGCSRRTRCLVHNPGPQPASTLHLHKQLSGCIVASEEIHGGVRAHQRIPSVVSRLDVFKYTSHPRPQHTVKAFIPVALARAAHPHP